MKYCNDVLLFSKCDFRHNNRAERVGDRAHALLPTSFRVALEESVGSA